MHRCGALSELLELPPPPEGLLICKSQPGSLFASPSHEIDRVTIQPAAKRVDLRWSRKADSGSWEPIIEPQLAKEIGEKLRGRFESFTNHRLPKLLEARIAGNSVQVSNPGSYSAVLGRSGPLLILDDYGLIEYLSEARKGLSHLTPTEWGSVCASCVFAVFIPVIRSYQNQPPQEDLLHSIVHVTSLQGGRLNIGRELERALEPSISELWVIQQKFLDRIFNPWAWERKQVVH